MSTAMVRIPAEAPQNCGECGERLRDALARHDGIRSVTTASDGAVLIAEIDADRCSERCARAALAAERSGLRARYGHTELLVDGMDCGACAETIVAAVTGLPDVSSAAVSFATGRMLVEHTHDGLATDRLRRRVRRLGYEARIEQDDEDGAAATGPQVGAVLALLATVLLIVAVVVDLTTSLPAAWFYGAAVAAGIGPIARSGVVALWTTRRPEIKLLMTIAAIGAIGIGAWMEAALVVVLFSIGELLEARAVARARNELTEIVSLTPDRARVRDDAGTEHDVAAATLAVGDIVVVLPGERLPADGDLLEGASAIDQSPVTGESVPVDKGSGDEVFAGTLNGEGRLVVAVRSAPGDTTVARIARLVTEAQARKSPSERWVDAFARIYTPVVIALAVLVAAVPPLAWGASFDNSFYAALALLILACPCALVLSTPVTIVSALARATAAGVLVKGGEQLEQAATIDTVAFDKTGTLTAGRPRLVSVDALGGGEDELLALAASLESGSQHPLAAAIVAAAAGRGLALRPLEDFQSRSGFGAEGVVGGVAVAAGKPAMFAEMVSEPAVANALAACRDAGQTAIVVVREGRPAGVFGLADTPRPEAREAIAQLGALGVTRTVMLTGDNPASAAAVAGEVGVGEIRADTLPADKARIIAELGPAVAMVGDGINDAPALASATLGVAMGSGGSATAIEVADAALIGDDPRKVPGLIGLARLTRATVRQNIAFSLMTKAGAALLLAFGLLPLWAAVVADVGTSLIVVAWGLRVMVAPAPGGAPILPAVRRAPA